MSYYYKHNYQFSAHGIQRCRERLNLKGKDDFEVRDTVIKLIKKSNHSFETSRDLYLSAGNSNIYFVINKESNLIITATPVSAEKQWTMMNENFD